MSNIHKEMDYLFTEKNRVCLLSEAIIVTKVDVTFFAALLLLRMAYTAG